MAFQSIWREKNFNRDAEFVICKAFDLPPKQRPGEQFDKTLVTTRKLRQLYEQRYLNIVEANKPPPPPPVGLKIAPVLKHFGFGKWAVVRGVRRVTELMTKPEAQAALERLLS